MTIVAKQFADYAVIMVTLCNKADHYIFALWFLSFFFFFPRLISAVKFRRHVWNVLHAARWKYRTQKNPHFGTIAQLCRAVSSQLRHVSTVGKTC